MALKRQTSIAETKPATTSSDRPSTKIDGELVTRFNAAVADVKDAEARVESVRAKLLEKGIAFLYGYNIDHPTATTKSVDVVDAAGSVVRLTSQSKYSAANADAADALFESLSKAHPKLKIDINDYVQETVTAAFDSKVFLDKEGRFSDEIYRVYAAAIENVTKDLTRIGALPTGTVSPLKSTKKVVPLASFDEQRYVLFDSVKEQNEIRAVLQNTITLTPSVT